MLQDTRKVDVSRLGGVNLPFLWERRSEGLSLGVVANQSE